MVGGRLLRVVTGVLVLVVGVVVACGAATARGTASAGGCGHSVAPGSTSSTFTLEGRARTVIVHIPTGYSGSKRVPLVLNLHGSGSTAAAQERFTGMDVTADAHGFIVAYPQGLIPEGTGFDWNVPGVPLVGGRAVPNGAAADITFLTKLVGVLGQTLCIDSHRVFATGFSGGARIASQLACDAATTFAAVAPVSGLRHPSPCPATRPIAVISFHGTADPIDPYGGHGQAYWTYSVLQAAKDWAVQDKCASKAKKSKQAPGATLATYTGCSRGTTVELYTISGEGHEWPGGPHLPRLYTSVLGPQSNAANADTLIWAFFAAHPLR
ncbi:MAG: alpha/beta hydrolase family esterase [Gaiellaceae bacterium]